MPPQSTAQPAADIADQIVGLLANPPDVAGIEFDSTYFAPVASSRDVTTSRVLLPKEFQWRSVRAGKTSVPLQLCEFLAYKTGLAYETEARIKAFLETCCVGITPQNSHFRFFDSARNGADAHGILADAQGYGFVFERKAFVIFRGTQGRNDWQINRTDTLTDKLGKADRLRKDYGKLLDKLGLPSPGRHVGFSIAWAALKDDVEDWLADLLERREIDQIVYSGHSLGGAMAQIAAFDHARIADAVGKDRGIAIDHIAAVVTFGAPAVGGDALAKEYARLLGERTVLLESSGDLVPRIMQRWYYRMLYPLRQRVLAGVQERVQERVKESNGFEKVVTAWTFASEPPLSDSDIDSALNVLREVGKKLIEKAADEKKKLEEEHAKTDNAEREKAERKQKDQDGTPADPAAAPQTTAAGADKPANVSGGAPAPVSRGVYVVLIGIVALAAIGITWYFVRRKLFSHDIEQRYALYLSTLSYQRLRAKHNGDLDLANQELEEHLRFVRGDMSSSSAIAKAILDSDNKPTPFYDSVQGLPVRIVREIAGASGSDQTQGTPALVLVYRFLVGKLSGAGGKDQAQGSPVRVFKLPQDPVFAEFLTKPDTFV